MPVRMTKEGRAETREAKRSEQANQQAMSAKAASNSPSEGKGSTKAKEPKSPTERKNENKAQIREARMTSTAKRYGERYTPGMLTGGQAKIAAKAPHTKHTQHCLLYTSPSPRDGLLSRMPSSA